MQKTENIMGTKKVMPLLISMSVPPMISMLIQALYNIVDSMYVARVSEDALTAVSIAFPLQNLIIAVSCGFGIGLSSCVARALGAKDEKEVTSAATHGFLLSGIHWLLFVLMGLFITGPFLRNFTDSPQIYEMSCQYTQIVLCFSIGSMYHLYAEKLFQATGSMVLPMIFQGAGAIFNIILDPIFIFGWFGIPAMGVTGAAIATVASQIFAAALSMVFFLKKCTSVRIHLKGFRFEKNMLWKIYTVAIPSAIMMSLPSVLVAALNSVLAAFSATAIAVFGLYIKIQTFVYMPANGVIQGMRPIMSYNYGAGNRKRMKETLKASLEAAGVIMALGTVLFMAFPQGIMKLFNANAEMLEIGVPMLRIIAIGFIISTVGCVLSGAFEALGKGVQSLVVSLLRQLVIIIPMSAVLAKTAGLYGVWATFPVAELIAAIIGCILYRNFMKKITLLS
ncbi:MAG: MATE family efflux transporter [Eubacteriales bacterium]|nr:MATE family efflux transporter [Eubacteriales bacterium]